jgi:predicted DNA-binding transcriptional regulator YafY
MYFLFLLFVNKTQTTMKLKIWNDISEFLYPISRTIENFHMEITESSKRIKRLLNIVILVKTEPWKSVPELISQLDISRSQFYKDKDLLATLGFSFDYSRSEKRFVISKDSFIPAEDLTLSEKLSLIMAFRQLSASGDYVLSYDGFQAARKLALSLPEPLRESIFEDIVLLQGFGCKKEILKKAQQAVTEKQRIIISYKRPDQEKTTDYELDPYHLFFRKRALYLEGYSWTDNDFRMFRLNRIQRLKSTPYRFSKPKAGYDFGQRHKNAFFAFPGEKTEKVVVKFTNKIRPFIEETLWHHSQQVNEAGNGDIYFTVHIAEPREVMWWTLSWGSEAEVIEPKWLRELAGEEIQSLAQKYQRV